MSWHEGERATVIAGVILAAVALVAYIGIVHAAWNFATLTTPDQRPLAPDFANFWSAAKLARSGKAAAAYDLDRLYQVEEQVFGTHSRYGSGWYYPPTFLLAVLPLGWLPYVPALLIWLTVTMALYSLVWSRLCTHPILIPLFFLFPAMFHNFLIGQNGFLTGALLGGGLMILDGWPLAGGCLFGLMTYKPQLVILVFPALLLARRWKALSAAVATSLLLILISVAVFGYQLWFTYFQAMALPMREVAMGSAPWRIMPTFFVAVRAAGGGVTAAYLVQGLVMLAVAAGVAWVWRQPAAPLASRGTVLILGVLLFTPYEFDYDLVILALALGWLWEEGRRRGRLPGELLLLLAGWLLPAAAPILYTWINLLHRHLQIGPVILAALFLLSLSRARTSGIRGQ
ncbi:MAG: glycosyltransferase family 87 protein [Desulfobaccales bacterium]